MFLLKIEKINDRQIRFILSEDDLASRQIKLSELAYGTDKAKELFQEMMQEAATKCGFDVSNSPLMIEAVPMRGGYIVLIVTKMENPEELDSRFSSFSPAVQNTFSTNPQNEGQAQSAFEQVFHSLIPNADSSQERNNAAKAAGESNEMAQKRAAAAQETMQEYRRFSLLHRLYLFPSMDNLLNACAEVGDQYKGESSLYKEDDVYSLFLTMKDAQTVQSMQNVLARLSEYGNAAPITSAKEQYLVEHGHILIKEDALKTLAHLA